MDNINADIDANMEKRPIQDVSWDNFNHGAFYIAQCIRQDIKDGKIPPIEGVIGFSRGGLPLATVLAYALGIKCVYTDEEFGDSTAVEGHYLLVDDISDSGTTFKKYVPVFTEKVKFTTAALFMRPGTAFVVDYAAFNAGNNWLNFPWEFDLDAQP